MKRIHRLRFATILLFGAALVCAGLASAIPPDSAPARQEKGGTDRDDEDPWSSATFAGLKFRSVGPALMSGRIGDIAVDPRNRYHWYIAVCSGGVWETHNAGTTWQPIFDDQNSYSIGCLAIDPSNPNIVWVGSGENNSQRSVSYGDGIYKSSDGGRSWRNVGLERSLHIGKIIVHPDDGHIVYAAAMGPLWGPGGDRGLYKSVDGGEEWERILEIDENTGVVDVVMDPRDPDVLYAAAYQRRRHVWTLIDGGPGSGIYKSVDGGEEWEELTRGLPHADLGRIGLAIAPKRPDTIYAIVESIDGEGGFFRSTDAGANWQKMNDYVSSSPQYYQEIVADPHDPDRVYSLDTYMQVTEDGGRTFARVPGKFKHVDDHALWIDPENADHLIAGCDGGLYETFDRAETWRFAANLPITQFYKLAVDNDEPFYNIYGGTQDNNTQGGPARTISRNGITNRDWFVTLGGDGFEPAVDPTNPDIVYCQWQYGNLVRYDRKSGEIIDIQPQPPAGETLRWNWDAALIISPHDPRRLYFGSQQLLRSDDRGDSWTAVSGDLTRNLDRNRLEVMDRVWGVDTVAKNRSTSFYGNIVALSESPHEEGVIYVGTDDGLVQVTRDGGRQWTRHDKFSGAPEMAYVACLTASEHERGVVYACLDNHKQDDFKPYVLKSTNYGDSWRNIAGDLPERGTAYAIVQDHIDPQLLFVGTEFGVFFSRDDGKHWLQLKAGIPTIACRDLAIQHRESDLVVATFGRSFYVLDDYSPLRGLAPEDLQQPALLFPVKPTWLYVESRPLGGRTKGSQGDAFYGAENPPAGAVFTYYLRDGLKTLEQARQEAERALIDDDEPVYYPAWDELRAEERELKPAILLTVRDSGGNVVRRVTGPTGAGLHRIAWDLRYPATSPIRLSDAAERAPWEELPSGPLAVPGTYSVILSQRVQGVQTDLADPVEFTVQPLNLNALAAADPVAALAFRREAAELSRSVQAASLVADDAQSRLNHLRRAVLATTAADSRYLDRIDSLENQLHDLLITLEGDRTVSSRSEPTTPSVRGRVDRVNGGLSATTCAPTQTQRENLAVAAGQFGPLLAQLKELVEVDLVGLENELEHLGAPHTPGRVPTWR